MLKSVNTKMLKYHNPSEKFFLDDPKQIKYVGCRGCDCMLVGCTTTYAIGAFHHWCCAGRGVQHYVIKFVSDLQQFGGFLWVLWFPPPIKLTAWYNWNIVESGVKHHKPNQNIENRHQL